MYSLEYTEEESYGLNPAPPHLVFIFFLNRVFAEYTVLYSLNPLNVLQENVNYIVH